MNYITDFITTQPEIIWLIAFMGAVAVIGLVNFLKYFIQGKKAVKWIVLITSLIIAIVLSPLTPPVVSTIVILWLLILAVSTMARNSIVDGLPAIINKITGSSKKDDK